MLEKNIILSGQLIQLEPLQKKHREILKKLSQDEKISTYSPALKLKFDGWFDKALKTFPQFEQFTFIVRHLKSNEVIGSTRYYEIGLSNKRLAIGYTWYTPSVWGTGVNLESKLMLLNYAFNSLNMNRVEFHIDSRNLRSCFAVEHLGATKEGLLRKNIILDDGYVRDTVIYSILKKEWPSLSNKLNEKLNNIRTNKTTGK